MLSELKTYGWFGKMYRKVKRTPEFKIASLELEVQQLAQELGDCYEYAVFLFKILDPQCIPEKKLMHVLTQIDNAITVIPKLQSALDAQSAVILDMEREAARLEKEKQILREQVQIASDQIQRLQKQLDMWRASRSGEL